MARLQLSRLLLCRGSRRFSCYVARQSKRPQPRGLFTRGQTGCLVFGHCFLTLEPPLFFLLEDRLGSTACLMSVQRRYSLLWRNPSQRTDLAWGPDAVCRCGVGQLNQRRSSLFVPRAPPSSFFRPGHATCPNIARYRSKRPLWGKGSFQRLSCHRGSQNRSARTVRPVAMKCT